LIVLNQTLVCQKIFSTNCTFGSYFNTTLNQCLSIELPNCRYINEANPQVCLSCITGYYLQNGVCYSISGCSLYSYITGCINCISGFLLQGDLCVKDLCQQYSSSGVCQTCLSGYVLRNNTCFNYTSNCQSYQLNQTTNVGCLQCFSGYQLIDGLCYKLPDNCVSMNSSTYQCLQCAAGFTQFTDSICYRIIPNCSNQIGAICRSCANGFYLSFDSSSCVLIVPIYQCQNQDYANNRCIQCNSGFTLTSNYTCIAINCVEYNLSSSVCTSCRQGFYLSGEICLTISIANCSVVLNQTYCSQCNNGFVNINGRCYPSINNCVNYTAAGFCAQCATGFYINTQNNCALLPNFCSNANSNGNCLNCISGYTLVGSTCFIFIPNCSQYNSNSGSCTNCSQGFYLSPNNTCLVMPRNCLLVNSLGNCIKCIDLYTLYNNICYNTISNCVIYSPSTQLCSQLAILEK